MRATKMIKIDFFNGNSQENFENMLFPCLLKKTALPLLVENREGKIDLSVTLTILLGPVFQRVFGSSFNRD